MSYDIERHRILYDFDPDFIWNCWITEDGAPMFPDLVKKTTQDDENRLRRPIGYDVELHSLYDYTPTSLHLCVRDDRHQKDTFDRAVEWALIGLNALRAMNRVWELLRWTKQDEEKKIATNVPWEN